jgi:hypothetical protein
MALDHPLAAIDLDTCLFRYPSRHHPNQQDRSLITIQHAMPQRKIFRGLVAINGEVLGYTGVVSHWHYASQLINLYPADWQTMVNNCRAVQCFGANTMLAARAMADLVGYPRAEDLLDLDDNEMLLQPFGDLPVIARLPNYREDEAFAGQFDEPVS